MKKHKNDEIFGELLCILAEKIAPTTSEICRYQFYQPKEPEGFKAFIERKRIEGTLGN